MIQDIRDSVSSWPMRIALGLLIFSFIGFYGWSSRSELSSDVLAKVNGEEIHSRDFAVRFQNVLQNYQQQGQTIPEAFHGMIKQQLLNSMIGQKLKLSEAKQVGLVPSNDKIRETIKKQFSDEKGNFNYKFYETYLRNQLGKTPGQFEEDARNDFRSGLFDDFMQNTGISSDVQLKEWYRHTNEKVAISYVKLNTKNTASFRPKTKTPSNEELQKYFTDNSDEFKSKEKRKLDILYFEKNSFPATKDFTKDAEAKLQELSQKNPSFAQAAKADATVKHIESGFVTYEDTLPPLTPGELSEVLNAAVGLEKDKSTYLISRDDSKVYLIKSTDIQAAVLPEFASIKSSVEKNYMDKMNREGFETWVQDTWKQIQSGQLSMEAFAKKPGLTLSSTEPFSFEANGTITGLGTNDKIMKDSFQLSTEKPFINEPVKVEDDYVFVKLKNKVSPDWKKFETEHVNIADTLYQETGRARFQSWMKYLREKANVKEHLQANAAPAASAQ
jgi:hypothetical protein